LDRPLNDGVISLTKGCRPKLGKMWPPKKLPTSGAVLESIEPSQFWPHQGYLQWIEHLLGDAKPYFYKTENYGKRRELFVLIPMDSLLILLALLEGRPKNERLVNAGTRIWMLFPLMTVHLEKISQYLRYANHRHCYSSRRFNFELWDVILILDNIKPL